MDAVEIFRKNDHWRKVYDAAPAGAKAYYEALFADSLRGVETDDDETVTRAEEAMTAEDWLYVSETCGNRTGRSHCRKMANAKSENPKEA